MLTIFSKELALIKKDYFILKEITVYCNAKSLAIKRITIIKN